MSYEKLTLARQFVEENQLGQLEEVWRLVASRINQTLGMDGSVTWNPGNVINGANVSTTVTVRGAVLGDYAIASFSLDVQDLQLTADVTAADTVTVILHNDFTAVGGINLAEGTLRARVWQR